MISTFLKDFIKYIPSKVLPGVFGILVMPVLTRLFLPSEYGQYTIVISTITILGIIATDWIAPSIVRFYAEYENRSMLDTFYGTLFVMMLGSIIIMLLLSYAALYMFKPYLENAVFGYIQIGLILFSTSVAYNVMMQLLIVQRKILNYSFFYVWKQCVCIIIGIVFVIYIQRDVAGLLWGSIIGIVLAGPILYFYTFQGVRLNTYSKGLKSEVMQYGFPLIATNIGSWVLTLSDRYIIDFFRGSHEVGLYSISYSLADRTISLLVSIIVIASGPIVMQIWEKEGEKETILFLSKLTKILLMILLPASVGLSILAKPIVKVIAAKEYFDGYVVIPMVAASIFLFGVQRNFQLVLLFHKKTRVIMYILGVSGLLNIILNLLLVPKYGFLAAGYSTLISYGVFAVSTIVVSRKYLKWEFPFGTLRKVALSTALMVVVLYLSMGIKISSDIVRVLLLITIGSATHVIMMFFTKEIELVNIKNIFKKKN